MPDRGEVGADLMGAPGLQARLEIGLGGEQLQHGEVGARLARGRARDRHPVPLPRGAADRGVDRPGARGEAAAGEGQVEALDLAPLTWRLERRVRRVGAGDDQQAAGALVETVDDARSLRVRRPAKDLAQLADQGRAAVRGRRVDDEAGGLVDDGERLVEVDDAQLRVTRLSAPAGRRARAAPRRP